MVKGEVDVGKGLRLDTLRCIDNEQRAVACGKASGNLIVEVNMPGVSIMFKMYSSPSAALYTVRTACALIVMPRSRSRSILSST